MPSGQSPISVFDATPSVSPRRRTSAPRLRALVVAAGLAVAGVAMSPRPAYGCLWNIFHLFVPMPPCSVADHPTAYRIAQANHRIVAKLAVIAAHIREIEAEIAGWNNAVTAAQVFQNRLVQVYGDLSANPIPSLAFEYRQYGVTSYVRRRPDGTFAVGVAPVDLRRVADTVWAAFHDTTALARLYGRTWARSGADLSPNIFGVGRALDGQIAALGDYHTAARPTLDSLSRIGDRTAGRYAGRADVAGLSEARISDLAISLSKLRGTVFEAQADAIAASLQSLAATAATQRAIDRERAAETSVLSF